MASATEIAAVVSALGASGILGAAARIRFSGVEKETIGNAASQAAVDVFESSIANLKADLEAARADTARVREEGHEREATIRREHVEELDRLRRDHAAEIAELKEHQAAEVSALRSEVHQLRDEFRRLAP